MKIEMIIISIVICIGLFLLFNSIILTIAKSICEESEIRPVRYETRGLFGNQLIPIPTTKGNEDEYAKVCIKKGEPKFWSISDNIEYILKKSKE